MGAQLRPPSGHCVGLAPGIMPVQLDLSALDPAVDPWRPRTVGSPWAGDCPEAPLAGAPAPALGEC
eukprot:13115682-Alexandrium_andersonii.AAC.1